MSQINRVLVVGGGITGLTVSAALAQKGVEVVLVELREHVTKSGKRKWLKVGHGLTIQGNALRAFAKIGVAEKVIANGYPFNHLRMRLAHNGDVLQELPTPPMGGPGLPGTCGALRSDLSKILIKAVRRAGVDVRLGSTVTELDDHSLDGRGGSITATLSDGTKETVDLVIGADGIRSTMRKMIGIETEPAPVGMGIWRVVAARPPEMDCSELYFGGPKYKAGYTPISEDLCYAFLLEENLDKSYLGEHANGKTFKEHGAGYGGTWGKVRDSVADDALVNYQWIEAICVDEPWYRGRTILIGDAVHACPPLIAQGAAMCAEDAVILAEMLTEGGADEAIESVLKAFWERRYPRVKMVLDNSLTLAEWEMHPETPGADPGRIMGQTLGALVAPA